MYAKNIKNAFPPEKYRTALDAGRSSYLIICGESGNNNDNCDWYYQSNRTTYADEHAMCARALVLDY